LTKISQKQLNLTRKKLKLIKKTQKKRLLGKALYILLALKTMLQLQQNCQLKPCLCSIVFHHANVHGGKDVLHQ
jgi:hypothetical protein